MEASNIAKYGSIPNMVHHSRYGIPVKLVAYFQIWKYGIIPNIEATAQYGSVTLDMEIPVQIWSHLSKYGCNRLSMSEYGSLCPNPDSDWIRCDTKSMG